MKKNPKLFLASGFAAAGVVAAVVAISAPTANAASHPGKVTTYRTASHKAMSPALSDGVGGTSGYGIVVGSDSSYGRGE